LFAALGLLAMVAARTQIADLDMFHQMSLFRAALEMGFLPRYDVFAFTPTVVPSVHHEWGTGGILYAVAVAMGWGGAGVLVLRYLLLAGIVAITYSTARRNGATGALLMIGVPLAIAMLAVGLSTLRAQMFTFFFLACLLHFLERDRQGDRTWILLWVPIYLVWLNLHGGFLVGAGLVAVYTVERSWMAFRAGPDARRVPGEVRHLLLLLAAMGALVLVNPYGADFIPVMWDSIRMERPMIAEWAPLWSSLVQAPLKVSYAASLLLAGYVVVKRRGLPPGMSLVLVSAVVALGAQRMSPIYAIVWFCYVPALLSGTELRLLTDRLLYRARLPLVAILLFVGLGSTVEAVSARPSRLRMPTTPTADGPHYPVGATQYLQANGFSGNLMTDYDAGSFVSWTLHPEVLVGMDSRYEAAYTEDLVEEVFRLYAGARGWEETLRRYPADAVLVAVDSPLDRLLASSGGEEFGEIYRDDGFALYALTDRARALPVMDRRGETIEGVFPGETNP